MKNVIEGKINIEISRKEIREEIAILIRKLCEQEIKEIIKETARELVKNEIDKILDPLVISVLNNEKLDIKARAGYSSHWKDTVERQITRLIIEYLNKPCYLYSKSSKELHEKFKPSSCISDKTRIELYLSTVLDRYFGSFLEEKAQEILNSYKENKEKIESIMEVKLKKMIKESL